MGMYRLKGDELAKLSSSIFVMNFPDKFSAKELWTVCKQYGIVVDAFIPDRRSKAGKRFGFVRFIKIFDVDRLVNNLCTIWVGRFKLHANIARFQRPPLNKNNSQSSHNKGDQSAPKDFYKESGENVNSKSYAHVVNAVPHQFHKKEDSPAIVLDETYANKTDYSLALLGKVKDFTSLTNLNVVLANEGFVNVKLKYMGGFWVMIVFTSEVQKRRWSKVGLVHGLLSYFKHPILSSLMKELRGLISRDAYYSKCEGESRCLKEVAETIFEKEQASVESAYCDIPNSDDTLTYPPGFTSETDVDAQKNASKVLDMEGDNSGHKVQRRWSRNQYEYNYLLTAIRIITVMIYMLRLLELVKEDAMGLLDSGSQKLEWRAIWVKWNKVLASKEKGGLGVSSFYALNRALLFKWVWRFCTQQSALWTKIIKGIHGEDGKIGKHVRSHHPSLWLDIVKEVQHIQRQGTDLMGFIHRKMGNGVDIRFWEDKWRGDNTFQSDFPRMYALETQKNISVALKLSHDDLLCSFRRAPRAGAEELQYIQLVKIMEGITLFDSKDRWRWSLEGCGEFTVASVRNLLDANSLPVVSSKTRWIKAVPIKVNIHAWKVKLDILPTRLNISKRGMDIESILCPLCEKNVESSSHIFFTCPISREIFHKVLLWWEIDVVMASSYDECSNETQAEVGVVGDFIEGLVPLVDAIQERDMILMYTHHNRLHVYVSRVELSPLVVAEQHSDETNKNENQGKPSCAKKLFD
ncbi:RNA-directed DNA polymerase, eukaryota, reverse transcriptase zinc-binding domain protein [Tanacetum coccineum]